MNNIIHGSLLSFIVSGNGNSVRSLFLFLVRVLLRQVKLSRNGRRRRKEGEGEGGRLPGNNLRRSASSNPSTRPAFVSLPFTLIHPSFSPLDHNPERLSSPVPYRSHPSFPPFLHSLFPPVLPNRLLFPLLQLPYRKLTSFMMVQFPYGCLPPVRFPLASWGVMQR